MTATASCEALSAFADGELHGAEAQQFQRHLTGCAACAKGLAETMILDELVIEHTFRPRRQQRWRLPLVAAATFALAAATVLFLRRETPPQPAVLVAQLAAAGPRTSQARLSYPGADGHRPFAPMRGASPAAPSSPVEILGRIDATGDRHATATSYFLLGMRAQAEAQLAALPESAAVLSDRAAALLELGRTEDALALLDRALRLSPDHRPARWNRALALRALGRRAEARRAFTELAAADAPGWAEEARANVQGSPP